MKRFSNEDEVEPVIRFIMQRDRENRIEEGEKERERKGVREREREGER